MTTLIVLRADDDNYIVHKDHKIIGKELTVLSGTEDDYSEISKSEADIIMKELEQHGSDLNNDKNTKSKRR